MKKRRKINGNYAISKRVVGCDDYRNYQQKLIQAGKEKQKRDDVYAWLGVGVILVIVIGSIIYAILTLG